MIEMDMCADGLNRDGVRTYTITINKTTYKGLTMDEAMKILGKAEEEGKS